MRMTPPAVEICGATLGPREFLAGGYLFRDTFNCGSRQLHARGDRAGGRGLYPVSGRSVLFFDLGPMMGFPRLSRQEIPATWYCLKKRIQYRKQRRIKQEVQCDKGCRAVRRVGDRLL